MKITVIEKSTVNDIVNERTAEVDYGHGITYDGVPKLVVGLFEAIQEPEEE